MNSLRPKSRLDTDEGCAEVCVEWVSGFKQREIAKRYGYKTAAPINRKVVYFIYKYCPDYMHGGYIYARPYRDFLPAKYYNRPAYNNERKAVVCKALERYRAKTNGHINS